MATQTKKRGAVDPELSSLEWHALKRAGGKADKLRDRLEIAAAAPVDFVVHIKGSMSVAGEACSVAGKSPAAKVLLAIALAAVGPANREKISEAVRTACREWMTGGEEPRPTAEDNQRADDLLALVTREEEVRRNGNVTGILECKVIERAG